MKLGNLARLLAAASITCLLTLLVTPLFAKEPRALSGSVAAETFIYADDNHVDVLTPAVAGTIENTLTGWSISGSYLVDVVTAASPDIIASASPPFRELRHAGTLGGTYSFHPDLAVTANLAISAEPDYLSLSGGLRAALDLAQKNYTVFLGYSHRNDTVGRGGTSFDVFGRKFQTHDLSGGVSIVLNRSALLTLQMDGVFERGDQSKPYRYVPLFEVGTANLVQPGASVELVNASRLDARPLEVLPQQRDRYAFTARFARRFSKSTLRVEERLYADTWGVKASTTDVRFLVDMGRRFTLWPHGRLHFQSGADFWQRAYEVLRPSPGILDFPVIRTGDRELSPLYSVTMGGGASLEI